MIAEIDFDTARDFGTALLLGALLGIEREKRNAREGFGIAGLRTFVMLVQIGAVAGFLAAKLGAPWVLAAALAGVVATVIAGYVVTVRAKPERMGLTTEFAAIVACLLGALTTTGHRELAIGLGVVTAALLAYKQPLHAMVGRIAWDDVLVGLRLLLGTFIVLPLLPDRAVDPWGALNPYTLWLLVLLISSVSLLGYLTTRWLGAGHGIAVTALTGGLVSSTAVTLGLVGQAKGRPEDAGRFAGGILLAWGVMFVRVLVTATIVCPPLLGPLALPCVAASGAAAAVGAVCLWRGSGGEAPSAVPLKNPFSLLAAGKFALLFAAVLLLLRFAKGWFPGQGVYVVAALAGLTDVDPVTLSMAEQAKTGAAAPGLAVAAIGIAAASNTLVKAGLAVAVGPRAMRVRVCAGTALILAAGALAVALG